MKSDPHSPEAADTDLRSMHRGAGLTGIAPDYDPESDELHPSPERPPPMARNGGTKSTSSALSTIEGGVQIIGGMAFGILPWLLGDLWIESNPFRTGNGLGKFSVGSVIANIIAFIVPLIFHGIAIPLFIQFKAHLMAVGIGLFYAIYAVGLLVD